MTGTWQQGRRPPTQGVPQHLRRRKITCLPQHRWCPTTLVSERNGAVLSHSIASCVYLLTAPERCLETHAKLVYRQLYSLAEAQEKWTWETAAPHPEDTQNSDGEAPFLKLEERPGSGKIPDEAKGETALQPPGVQESPTSQGLGAGPCRAAPCRAAPCGRTTPRPSARLTAAPAVLLEGSNSERLETVHVYPQSGEKPGTNQIREIWARGAPH